VCAEEMDASDGERRTLSATTVRNTQPSWLGVPERVWGKRGAAHMRDEQGGRGEGSTRAGGVAREAPSVCSRTGRARKGPGQRLVRVDGARDARPAVGACEARVALAVGAQRRPAHAPRVRGAVRAAPLLLDDLHPPCPVSTEGWTRRVHFVRGWAGACGVVIDQGRGQPTVAGRVTQGQGWPLRARARARRARLGAR